MPIPRPRYGASCVNVVEVWLSSFLPLEEMIANYPPQADARDDDSSNTGDKKIKK
jgi:hypothetical protein